MKKFCLCIFLLGLGISAFNQIKYDTLCYEQKLISEDKIFTKMEIYPGYKGETDKLNQFLIQNISIDKIAEAIGKNALFVSDTIQLRFVISKDKRMSNLTVSNAMNNSIQLEIERLLIQSSCNWTPGESSGRYLTGWFKKQMIFTLDRRDQFLAVKIEWIEIVPGQVWD